MLYALATEAGMMLCIGRPSKERDADAVHFYVHSPSTLTAFTTCAPGISHALQPYAHPRITPNDAIHNALPPLRAPCTRACTLPAAHASTPFSFRLSRIGSLAAIVHRIRGLRSIPQSHGDNCRTLKEVREAPRLVFSRGLAL